MYNAWKNKKSRRRGQSTHVDVYKIYLIEATKQFILLKNIMLMNVIFQSPWAL